MSSVTEDTTAVLVTGGTGFIAQHIIDRLLVRGYKVIGTARSEKRYKPILSLFQKKYPNAKLSYEVVPDISSSDAFDHVLQNHSEIKYVIHSASPVTFGVNKPLKEFYLDPAVNGTLNILKATKNFAPQVTNVVVTSSFAAIMSGGENKDVILTSSSWNPIKWEDVTDEMSAYLASKTYAEKAAREFVEKENPNFKFATVNPPYVLGPQVFDDSVTEVLNASNEILNNIIKTDNSITTPQTQFSSLAVDVRDVAEFHILPLENPKLANERQFIVSSPLIAQLVLDILNKNFPQLSANIAKGDPSSTEKIVEKFCPKYDISNIINATDGYKFIDLEKSIVDVYQQYFSKFSV